MKTNNRIIIVSDDVYQGEKIAKALLGVNLQIINQLKTQEINLENIDDQVVDVILYDLYSIQELDLDALDGLMDRCLLPVIFNDQQIGDNSQVFAEKIAQRFYDVVEKQSNKNTGDLYQNSPIKCASFSLESENWEGQTKLISQRSSQVLGQILIKSGLVSEKDVSTAISKQQQSGCQIGKELVNQGVVNEVDIATALSKQLDLPLIRQSSFPELAILTDRLSTRYIDKYQIFPVKDTKYNVFVAMLNPMDDKVIHDLEVAWLKPVMPCCVVEEEFHQGVSRLYHTEDNLMEQLADELGGNDDFSEDDVESLKDQACEAPIIRLVSFIIHNAINTRASDIHIEPFEKILKIRYRIDGVLQDVESPPAASRLAVISRIKIMAKLDIAERRLPQDGRTKLKIEGKNIDLRVSTLPTLHGERVVIRLLLNDNVANSFDSLGFAGKARTDFLKCLGLPHGVLLVTGPTGSGKTTTLYTSLQKINTPGKNIITVEDPVEYQLDGINQIQVQSSIGLSFSSALRSIVRQDPDIIMVGEIRDLETAEIAIQSALTGHMVISTLHTNDAPSSLTRLAEMGIDHYLISSAVNGVLAQRLVRKLCEHCKEPYLPESSLFEDLGVADTFQEEKNIYRAIGCTHCNTTGYNGRLCIIQMMPMSDAIKKVFSEQADAGQIAKIAYTEKVKTLFEDGIDKVWLGQTSIKEILRVTKE
ncbi:MAG: Flp pilus assembly complex ATPase component TadA [Methylococcales bacterium]|jgi:general secretion pathway protein E|nr:Flp pilus assembly complex ATPase component TadA [Methylococcales bacterium]MBT7409638.1 Flp pilus assembly complex ATPase component TadA [Methylococcales bacterium]